MILLAAPAIRAGTGSDLERARALFTEALADEEAGRAEIALGKFQQVQGVRDTAQVEYRIGTCLETLGRRRTALMAYDRSTRLGRGDAEAADVVASANDRIAKLATTMGKLSLDVHGTTAGVAVQVDGQAIDGEEVKSDIVLDPGPHTVDIMAPAMKPSHSNVTVDAGKRVVLSVELAPEPRPPTLSYTRRNLGIGMLAGGAALGIGAGVTLLVRQNLIDTIKSDCPGLMCPAALHDSIESMRSTATALMPLAITLGVVAIVAGGIGGLLIGLGPTRVTIGGTF